MTLGDFIKTYRERHDISLRKLEEITGLSFSYLSKVERGEYNPSIETILHLSERLNEDKAHLLELAGYKHIHELAYIHGSSSQSVDYESEYNKLLVEHQKLQRKLENLKEIIKMVLDI